MVVQLNKMNSFQYYCLLINNLIVETEKNRKVAE